MQCVTAVPDNLKRSDLLGYGSHDIPELQRLRSSLILQIVLLVLQGLANRKGWQRSLGHNYRDSHVI
jgi:hypothetical protein